MHLLWARFRVFVITASAGISVTTLLMTRPSLPAGSWSRGDDVALAAAWAVAVAASTWLFATSAACLVALGVRRPQLARAFARALPPALRRSVEVAIVASCLAVSAAPAHAVNGGPGRMIDQPVVRGLRALAVPPSTVPDHGPGVAPRTPATTPRTTIAGRVPPTAPSSRPSPSSRPTPTTSITPASAPRSAPASARPPANRTSDPSSSAPSSAPSSHDTRIVVRSGDNLWLIARAELIRSTGAYPKDAVVARYWRAVIEANRATLRSGDPSLIFPGEIVTLPPAPPVS